MCEIKKMNSSDLYSLNHFLQFILKKKVCFKRYANLNQLKNALVKAWNDISEEQVVNICDKFLKRLKACIKTKKIVKIYKHNFVLLIIYYAYAKN